MDHYLREIKIIADDLATINCSMPPREILKTTIMGLGPEYESLFTVVSLFGQNFPFETLRNHLLELEQRVIYLRSQESSSIHQAFDAAIASPGQPTAQQAGQQHSGTHYPVGQSQHPVGQQMQNRSQQRGGRGRGRGQYPVQYGQQPAYWYPQGQSTYHPGGVVHMHGV
ncbi:unnamed protein product [Cuscuta europaea]|uniref:Uncharacterized protein n=1 Tax=Cuscuta europaea TaxID=41803 RepID=A0A9P0YLQ5_CUSEU|nr:unnamed protein product [Cuscuta europaea]